MSLPKSSLLSLLVIFTIPQSDAICALLVTDFGAIGDGVYYDTAPIQAAVDACADAGGGRVVFPAGGTYLTGTIFLKSGVVLEVEEGATVAGSPEEDRYPAERERWYVVVAEKAADVGITGPGRIDGRGEAFVELVDAKKNVMKSWNRTGKCLGDECRPRLIGFVDSVNVRVWNVSLVNPAYWW